MLNSERKLMIRTQQKPKRESRLNSSNKTLKKKLRRNLKRSQKRKKPKFLMS